MLFIYLCHGDLRNNILVTVVLVRSRIFFKHDSAGPFKNYSF